MAHHPVVETGFGRTGPIRTVSASTLIKGTWALSLQMEHYDFDSFSDRELLAFSSSGLDVHSTDSITQGFLVGSYGITDDFTVGLKLPYVYFDNIREAHANEPGEVHIHGDARGIGDLSVFGQYRFFNASATEASVLFGLEFPTGRTDDEDIDDVRFETEFQPGSGSWDPFFGIAAQRSFGKIGLYTSLLYAVITEGSQDTDLGDCFSYNAAISYTPISGELTWDLLLELNGEFKHKQQIDGVDDPNSGGNTVLISPGMRLGWNKRISAFFSFGIPVAQDLNGVQTDLDYRILTGIGVSF
jgi:hypothetical protein